MITVVGNVCFTPGSGRAASSLKKSSKCHEQTVRVHRCEAAGLSSEFAK